MVAQPDIQRRERADARRAERLEAQRVLWDRSTLERVRLCRHRVNGDSVQVRVTEGSDGRRAGFAGLQTCGSVWACPVCSSKVLGHRQGEIETAVVRHLKDGGKIAFATFTVRHNRSHSLDEVWDAVSSAQAAMTSGREYRAEVARLGVEVDRVLVTECPAKSCGEDSGRGRRHARFCRLGTYDVKHVLPWLRVVEVTHGENGWHVHQHMVLFLPGSMTDVDLADLYDAMHARWARGAADGGLDGALKVNTCEFVTSPARIGEYVSKNTYGVKERSAGVMAAEVARGDLKVSRLGGKSSMQLMRDAVDEHAGARERRLWREFEQASQGRRQMTWSHGARLVLGLGVELTDEEAAAVEVGTDDDAVIEIDPSSWYRVVRTPGFQAELLACAERSTQEARDLLDTFGVRWRVPLVLARS